MAKNPEVFETPFDTYRATKVIGEGGSGRVFHVTNNSGASLALKCLRPELATSEKRKRFKNEIDFCTKHNHPNLLQVQDRGLVDWGGKSTLFYVMPYYPSTLREQIEKRTASPNDILRIFGQILDGVEVIHLRKSVHRDLKPENILHDPVSNLFVVADLGIAHFEEDIIATVVETKASDKLLNISYSAPEQRARGSTVDARADIYALGQMLNEMFTGTIPEGAGHRTIADVSPSCSYLDALVEKMRQQIPANRCQTIEDVKKELIGRKNQFISLQELDAKRNEVVFSGLRTALEPIIITEAQWDPSETLTLTLNRNPENGWSQHFRNPKYSTSYMANLSPVNFQFLGKTVMVRVQESYAQNAINQFKEWAPKVTAQLQEELDKIAIKNEQEQRRRLEQEIAAADAKARVNASLRI